LFDVHDERSMSMLEESRIEEAASRREQQEAQLYRPNGSKVYGDEEHAERVRAIRDRHRAEFDRIDSDLARDVEEAEERLLLAETRTPTSPTRSRPPSFSAPTRRAPSSPRT
jgi:hypothetical protein